MFSCKRSKLYIFLLAICLLLMAWPVVAENDEPLTLTVESDPDCLLSEAGEMTFFRFTLKNTLEEAYTLETMTLQGDLLEEPKFISESITVNANDVMEFTLENVRIDEDEFDRDLTFRLTWQTTSYAEEDTDRLDPIITEHALTAPIRVERFVEPVMGLTFASDVLLARQGDTVTVTYTLKNDTKFDMTNVTLQDDGIPQPIVALPKNVLNAGETLQATATFSMGSSAIVLNPTAQYTVRGNESKTAAAETITVDYVKVDILMDVEKYPATAEGTLFRITLTNAGTHPVNDIRIVDEIGSQVAEGISLDPGAERIVNHTVPSAVSSGTIRYISFEATGKDVVGGVVNVKSPAAYEVLPFVESGQVKLDLTVTLSGTDQTADGSNRLKLLFEVHNDSQVPIHTAVITESDYFKSVVNEYPTLSTGATTFEKEFVVPSGTRSLTFVMTAVDPSETQYATVPLTLDLSPLTETKATALPAIKPGKTVDITGTIYDTEHYAWIFRMAALIVLALTMVFLLLAIIFRVAEMNIRRWLPREPVNRPFGPRKTATGPISVRETVDPVHDQFGYVQPAKLRYMDRTDRLPRLVEGEAAPEPVNAVTVPINTLTKPIPPTRTGAIPRREEGDITAVPTQRNRPRPVMMTSEDTVAFAPVREGQEEPAAERSSGPRVIEMKPAARIVPRRKLEIVRVSEP